MVHIRKISEDDIIWVNKGDMTPDQISKALSRFKVNYDSEIPVKTARYIIATSSAFATGLTLNEAISVTFLEPDFNAVTILQGFARHWRQGNKNKKVYSYLLIAVGNHTEDRIQNKNKLRGAIQEATKRKVNETTDLVSEELEVEDTLEV